MKVEKHAIPTKATTATIRRYQGLGSDTLVADRCTFDMSIMQTLAASDNLRIVRRQLRAGDVHLKCGVFHSVLGV